jgi:hypothetical protein
MKLVTRARLLALSLALGTAAVACGSGSNTTPQVVASDSNQLGQVGMQLTLPSGVTITSVNYSVMGPTPQTGTVPIGSAQDVQFVVGGLLAGSYTIQLTATDSSGDPCSGSGAFSVTPGAVTSVSVAMTCIADSDAVVPAPVNTGSVVVEAGVSLEAGSPTVCPGITALTVTPAALPVGSSAAVSVATIGGTPTIQWTQSDAPGQTGAGTFADATAASTTFTCTQGGQAVVTVSVATGACVGVPFTTMFALVTCEGNADAGSDASPDVHEAGPSPCAQFNGGQGCTPTEQLFVDHDPTNGCYDCLVNGGCVDDAIYGDVGHECEDFGNPTQQAECTDTVKCILGSGCAQSGVAICYCGSSPVAGSCQGNPAPGPIDGVCASTIATGLNFPVGDGTDITKNLTNTILPGGAAVQLFQCAASNGCTSCLH